MALKIKCVPRFFVQVLSAIFLILRRTEEANVTDIPSSSCIVPVVLVRF